MADQVDNLTTCGHTPDRVCDNCPDDVKDRHRIFWKGFDK